MTNETSLLGKYASETLEDVHISAAPTDDPLAREDLIFRMTTEWKNWVAEAHRALQIRLA